MTTVSKRDYYEVLGVPRDVDEAGLKKAYRRLAMKFHPDRNKDNPTAEAQFKEVNEAYEVLKDPQKRAAYEQFGHAAFESGGPGPGGFGPEFASSMEDIFENFFGDFMGGRRGARGRPGHERGSDGHAARGQALRALVDGDLHEVVVVHGSLLRSVSGPTIRLEIGTRVGHVAARQGEGKDDDQVGQRQHDLVGDVFEAGCDAQAQTE